MTDPTDIDGLDEDEALAGELALRVLSPTEEAGARAREASDPAFATHVDAWNERLAGLADGVAPVGPSPWVWPRVGAGLTPPSPCTGSTIIAATRVGSMSSANRVSIPASESATLMP